MPESVLASIVHRIEMPTPYGVGPVNAYLVDAHPLTLIDAGINTPEAQEALFAGISAAGHTPQAVQRILITHAHPDHYGLVHVLQELGSPAVHFPEREIARVRDRQVLIEVGRLLVQAGIPLELLLKMNEQRRNDPRPKLDMELLRLVADGESFAFTAATDGAPRDFHLRAHLLPGHSGGHMIYVEPETKTAFVGDQLLPAVSPNPLLEPSLDEPGARRRSLEDYLASLERMAEMDLQLVYPGHGHPVPEPARLIRSTTEGHEKRKAEVAAHLSGEGKTPYELAIELFPGAEGYDVFLSVSEVVAHLDLVVDEGGAVLEEQEGVTYYRAAPGK